MRQKQGDWIGISDTNIGGDMAFKGIEGPIPYFRDNSGALHRYTWACTMNLFRTLSTSNALRTTNNGTADAHSQPEQRAVGTTSPIAHRRVDAVGMDPVQ